LGCNWATHGFARSSPEGKSFFATSLAREQSFAAAKHSATPVQAPAPVPTVAVPVLEVSPLVERLDPPEPSLPGELHAGKVTMKPRVRMILCMIVSLLFDLAARSFRRRDCEKPASRQGIEVPVIGADGRVARIGKDGERGRALQRAAGTAYGAGVTEKPAALQP
jgi:hypothetical protein